MGRQRTDFYRFFDYQESLSRSAAGRVQWDVQSSQQAYLSTTGMPWVAFELEAVGSDAAWTIQTADTDARESPSWEPLESGTVSQGTTQTIFVDRILARHVALHLDSDGHTARVYQSAIPLNISIEDSTPVDVLVDDADPVDVDLVAQALSALTVDETAREIVGAQSVSGTTTQDVNPASNGASDPCDITIQNTGEDNGNAFWITDGSTAASKTGTKLKPGQSLTLERHVATDGDVQLHSDNGNNITAEILYRS